MPTLKNWYYKCEFPEEDREFLNGHFEGTVRFFYGINEYNHLIILVHGKFLLNNFDVYLEIYDVINEFRDVVGEECIYIFCCHPKQVCEKYYPIKKYVLNPYHDGSQWLGHCITDKKNLIIELSDDSITG